MITVQRETWDELSTDAAEVFQKHWESLGRDRDIIAIDVDHERYRKLEELGMLVCMVARDNRRVVGYSIWFLHHHFHYRSAGMMAMTDMYYLLPEYRRGGIGIRLWQAAEKELSFLGIVRAHTSCKVHEDHSRLFEMLGWKKTDYTFSKLLKGDNPCR